MNIQNLMPKRYVYIGDEKDIEANFLKSVLLVLDLEVMSAGENGKFEPKKPVTRAELAASIVKILKITNQI